MLRASLLPLPLFLAFAGGCPAPDPTEPSPTGDTGTPPEETDDPPTDTDSGDPTGTTGDSGTPTTTSRDLPTRPLPPIKTIACKGAPTATPGADVCAVVDGDDRRLIVGDVLLPYEVFEQGAVLIEDGLVQCVGCDCFEEAIGATQIVCPDAVISPGLINAHDHVGWMNGRPWVASDEGVDPDLRWEHRHDWRRGLRDNPEISEAGGGASRNQKLLGEVRFLLSGTTAIFGSGDLGGLLRDLDATGDGSSGVPGESAVYDTFPHDDGSGTLVADGCTEYGTDGAPSNDGYAPHVSEGIDAEARNELRCLIGQGNGATEHLRTGHGIVHGIGLQATEVQELADRHISVIWTPRSNIALYGETAPVVMMDTLGVSLGLGTDWLPSGSMNMLRELSCAASLNDTHFGGYFRDAELWKMATVGSARALAFDDRIGTLNPGMAADIAVFAKEGNSDYSAVVRGDLESVALVMKGGEVLSGNPPVVSALVTSTCDTVDVCGMDKSVCLDSTGSTLAQLGSLSYPLVNCGVPEDEPTCDPSRILTSDSVNGSSNYDGFTDLTDRDGDGIRNIEDLCPDVFDPIRPVDDGTQPDADSDGVGDVCDICPLDANATDCVPADPDDTDGDGYVSGEDNCTLVPNADQKDIDGDNRGDACDACPSTRSTNRPDGEFDIFALQDVYDPDHPVVDTTVTVGCTVTAVGPDLAWCQDAAGGPCSGIAIFSAGPSTYADKSAVQVGDEVQVTGDYTEFFGVSELVNPTFTLIQAGTAPAPVDVEPADLISGPSAEGWEGVLVRISNVEVTNVNPDAPRDFDEFEVDGLRIDDDIAEDIDNTYAFGTTFSEITGIHHFSFSNYKLLPRSVDEIVE